MIGSFFSGIVDLDPDPIFGSRGPGSSDPRLEIVDSDPSGSESGYLFFYIFFLFPEITTYTLQHYDLY